MKNQRDRSYRRRQRSSSYQRRKKHRSRSKSPKNRDSHSRRRSRSRSKDNQRKHHQNSEFYQERHQQEMQQKVRLAIRNNEIQFDPKAHEIFINMPGSKQEQLTEQAQSIQKIHQCILVRELFISGLSEMNQGFIKEIMSKYGEIESVEILKNFAFVRFYKVQDASNACAQYHTINMTLHSTHNPNFKIFFADHLKRWNVVSNHYHYEVRQYLVPVVYASVKNDLQFANEQYLNSLFGRYGFIRNLEIRRNELPGPKIYVLVEYETLTQALRARERLRNQRDKLGDRRSEITLLIDTDKVTRLYPNVNNQLRYQRKRQLTNSHINSYNNSINNMSHPGVGTQQAQDVYALIKQLAAKDSEQEHQESDWVGFLTRKKSFKVQVDLNLIHKVNFDLESILNVAYRGDFNQGLSRTDLLMAGKFKAANSLNIEAFNEYIRYFINKKRAGIIQSRFYLIYLIPPLPELNIPYPVASNEILALFFKSPIGQIRFP